MVKILSWNTLESGEGGAWSNGWGCPLEIQRRERLIQKIIEDGNYDVAKSRAEQILTQERYRRIRKTMLDEILSTEPSDFLLFQECTVGDFWDEPPLDPSQEDSLDNKFFAVFDSLYEKVNCHAKDEVVSEETLQHVYVRRDSGWAPSSSVALQSDAFVGGCLAEFTLCNDASKNCLDNMNDASSLILVNVHGKARNMRDPDLRLESISNLWEEIGSHFRDKNGDSAGWKGEVVLCGDWNTHLSDMIEPFKHVNSDSALMPVVGMLNNATTANDYPFFSTNHEDGFLAQYDGCLLLKSIAGASSSYLDLEDTRWNMTGFMPKGKNGKLSGDQPDAMYNNFTYHRGSNDSNHAGEGVYLNGVFLPGSRASMGLSDHLRIYTTIKVNGNHQENDDTQHVDTQSISPLSQRRPYRKYSHGDSSTDNESDEKLERGSTLKHLRG